MATNRDYTIPGVFADNGIPLPAAPVNGVTYRDDTVNNATVANGWKYNNIVPSEIFNRVMYIQTLITKQLDEQGILSWSSATDYVTHAIVMGSDGNLYKALQPSGPSTIVVDPATESNYVYWDPTAEQAIDSFFKESATSSINAYVVNNLESNAPLRQLYHGMQVIFFVGPGRTNTITNPTLNIEFPNGVFSGSKYITKENSAPLNVNDILENRFVITVYDGTSDTFTIVSTSKQDIARIANISHAVNISNGPVSYNATSVGTSLGAYLDGLTVNGMVTIANSGSSATLNVDGLGARPISRPNNQALQPADIDANNFSVFRYNSFTNKFELVSISKSNIINESATETYYYSTSGASEKTNYTIVSANTSFPTNRYADGMIVRFLAESTNNLSPSLNINGLGAKAIKKPTASGAFISLPAGEITTTIFTDLTYSLSLDAFVVGSTQSATDTAEGLIRIATQSETDTGTDATISVTPATLKSYIDQALLDRDNARYPVESFLIRAQNPSTLGFPGTWSAVPNDYLVYTGSSYKLINGQSARNGETEGHQLSIAEMPSHNHTTLTVDGSNPSAGPGVLRVGNDQRYPVTDVASSSSGSNEKHSHELKLKCVQMRFWRRTA